METNNRKKKYGMTREQERAASRLLGRHVSTAKALTLLIAALLCCASPMLLGLRLWEEIPPVVQTGLLGAEGLDDSMPRAVLVFGVPGLFCLLCTICHAQFWLHQRAETLPPTPVRLLGRWGLPVLSVLLCPLWMRSAAGRETGLRELAPCALALLLLLSGAHFFDCPRESKLAFHLRCIEYKAAAWRKTHRAAALSWMAAALLLLAVSFGAGRLGVLSAAATLLLLLLPLPAAFFFAAREAAQEKP